MTAVERGFWGMDTVLRGIVAQLIRLVLAAVPPWPGVLEGRAPLGHGAANNKNHGRGWHAQNLDPGFTPGGIAGTGAKRAAAHARTADGAPNDPKAGTRHQKPIPAPGH